MTSTTAGSATSDASSADGAGADTDETAARLVAAAAEVFAEKGYEGAGVQEIARRAGLTTGAIYSRYSGKAELLAEAIRGEATPQLDQLFATGEPAVRASELISRAGTNLVRRHPGPKQFLLLEAFVAARRDPEVAEVLREHLGGLRETFAKLIDYAKGSHDLDPDLDTEAAVHFCQAVGLGFLMYEAVNMSQPDAEAWKAIIRRLVAALQTADTAPPTA